MRDPRRTTAKRSRLKRRALLAIIILASSPAMADGPAEDAPRVLLPLQPTAGVGETQPNPFCDPFGSGNDAKRVQLTSGDKNPAIRLKPIGAAIGLQSIEGSADASQPRMTIEELGPPQVRTNPLVKSTHHENAQLVDTDVDDKVGMSPPAVLVVPPAQAETSQGQASSIVLMPPAPVQSAPLPNEVAPHDFGAQPPQIVTQVAPPTMTQPVAAPPVQPAVVAPNASPVVNPPTNPTVAVPVVVPPPVPLPVEMVVEPLALPAERTTQTIPDPVYFSMSDRFEDEPASPGDDPTPQAEGAEPESAGEAISMAGEEDPQPAEASLLPEPVKIAADGSIELGVAEPIALDDPEPQDDLQADLEPMDSVINEDGPSPIAIYRSEPELVQRDETPQERLHSKRYRPPVAVKQVPIAVERESDAKQPSVDSTVRAVQSLNLDGIQTGSGTKLTPLYMTRAQVRSLTLGGEIRDVKVTNKAVCQAFSAGPNQLKLIGTGNGVTRLVVWADTDDADAPTRVRTFEVHVEEAAVKQEDVASRAKMLNQTVRKAFPGSNVFVKSDSGKLLVTGRCDSEATAKKIIRMVRKSCLIPVQDQLTVR